MFAAIPTIEFVVHMELIAVRLFNALPISGEAILRGLKIRPAIALHSDHPDARVSKLRACRHVLHLAREIEPASWSRDTLPFLRLAFQSTG